MTPQEFCYWLQGVLEVTRPEQLDREQTDMIREHLQLVFTKVTGESAPDAVRRGLCGFNSDTRIC